MVLLFLVQGCASSKYATPKNDNEKSTLSEARRIINNIASVCSDTRKEYLLDIPIEFKQNNISVTINNRYTELYLPSNNSKSEFSQNELASYLDLMCGLDKKCKIVLTEYISTYTLVHELFHLTNSNRYLQKIEGSFAKHPAKSQRKMSFDEELKAESVLVKYLNQFEPEKMIEINNTFKNILQEHKVLLDPVKAKENWNSFKTDFMGTNLLKIYFFYHCSELVNDSSLEQLLFLK